MGQFGRGPSAVGICIDKVANLLDNILWHNRREGSLDAGKAMRQLRQPGPAGKIAFHRVGIGELQQ